MSRRSRSLVRERDRLARAIGMIVMGIAPAGAVSQACSSSSDSNETNVDASVDGVAADPSDGANESAADDANGGADASCALSVTYFDAGRTFDAEGGAIDLSCTYDLPCGLTPTLVNVGCDVLLGAPDGSPDAYIPIGCSIPEGSGCTDGSFTPGAGGHLGMMCLDCFGSGRRPRGARRASVVANDALGSYLATMAHEEAISVHAFARMEEELARFCAPRSLRSAAAKARRDEISHARVMSRFANERGAVFARPRVRPFEKRSLEAMAIENAVEGCVNETFGAVMLAWQSRCASDPSLRRAFGVIARDETSHAALSWSIAAWAEKRLDSRANHRVRRARDRAVDALVRSAKMETTNTCAAAAGLPSPADRENLIARMVAILALRHSPISAA